MKSRSRGWMCLEGWTHGPLCCTGTEGFSRGDDREVRQSLAAKGAENATPGADQSPPRCGPPDIIADGAAAGHAPSIAAALH
jgi:hypothetical protein